MPDPQQQTITTPLELEIRSVYSEQTKTWSLAVTSGKDEIFFWGSDVSGTPEQIESMQQALRDGLVRAAAKYGQDLFFKSKNPELAKVVDIVTGSMSWG